MDQQLDPHQPDTLGLPSGTSVPNHCLANESSPMNLITTARGSVSLAECNQVRTTHKDIRPQGMLAGPPGRGTRRFSSKDSCDRR